MTPDEIVSRLSEAQKRAVMLMTDDWRAGPSLMDEIVDHLSPLRERALVEREFLDAGSPKVQATDDTLTYQISACWWFRLTPLGQQVRHHLTSDAPNPSTRTGDTP